MERAGRGVVEAILAEWPEIEQGARRAVVLCGPGNNGGDGFVVARLLKERGWEVEVFLYGDAANGCRRMRGRTMSGGWRMGRVVPTDGSRVATTCRVAITDADLLIDALFGIGLAGPSVRMLATCSAGI